MIEFMIGFKRIVSHCESRLRYGKIIDKESYLADRSYIVHKVIPGNADTLIGCLPSDYEITFILTALINCENHLTALINCENH